MAFIEKKDPTVLNIKLTSKGREQLSKGKLNFKYYAIGDSEIDYEFNRKSEFNAFNSNILRPVDKNPKQVSFLLKSPDSDKYNEISSVPSTSNIITNNVQPLGFFNNTVTEFLTDSNHVKQPDIAIAISGVTGGTQLKLQKSSTYQANQNEPKVNDLLLVKWTNPLNINTTGYEINKTNPTPYLWYKIQNIISGTLNDNNLIIEVDRELPNFSGITGGSNNVLAGAMVYYNYNNYDDSSYATDNVDNALLSFLQNCQCPTVTFPFWNMSIIFTKNIAGINPENDKTYNDYNNRRYGGFVSYIQNQRKDDEDYKEILGVIHYTNNSVANTYGEGFYGDPLNPEELYTIPTLDIPTIMWHKSTGATLGIQLKATGELKYLTGATRSLNTKYYDLADSEGNVVGKVFYNLKIFLIEDQELLFAMSYKSNRSWTLPEQNIDINSSVTYGAPQSQLDYDITSTSPSTINGDDGTITIDNIINSTLSDDDTSLILEIRNNNDDKIYFNEITGDTTITNDDLITGYKLSADTYTSRLTDTGFIANENNPKTKTIEIDPINSKLNIFNENETFSKLNSYFNIKPESDSPTHIKINSSVIGNPFGSAYVTIASTGITNSELEDRYNEGEGSIGDDAREKWVKIPNDNSLSITNLTFKKPYQIIIRDATGDTFSDIILDDVIESQIWSYFVAAGNPLNNAQDINVTKGSDSNGDYVAISDYLDTPLDDNFNPVVGNIEISIYETDKLPEEWYDANNDGSTIKIYLTDMASGTYNVKIREKYNYITMYSIVANDTFTI